MLNHSMQSFVSHGSYQRNNAQLALGANKRFFVNIFVEYLFSVFLAFFVEKDRRDLFKTSQI